MFGKKKKIVPSKGRGTIGIIVLLLIGSAGLRLVASADAVLASVDVKTEDAVSTGTTNKPMPSDEEFDAMLRAFELRESRIKEQEEMIDKRMDALKTAEEKIALQLNELETAETQLRSTIALASTAAEDDLARLTAVYENMKAKTAAALFEEMAPEFAAGFLGRMRPDAAAAIMAGMTPESAYTVSTILAGRNANVPKE
jgi:flagellar motility protein MotE (MotC chaperone)